MRARKRNFHRPWSVTAEGVRGFGARHALTNKALAYQANRTAAVTAVSLARALKRASYWPETERRGVMS